MEKITIKSFKNGEYIPKVYSCEGNDISPEITIDEASESKYYMLIMNDPDAPMGLFTHWVIYNMQLKQGQLHENIEKAPITKEGFYQGHNDFGKIGYGGPCPPKGDKPHRYNFNLYMQDSKIDEEAITVKKAYDLAYKFLKVASYLGMYKR
ncbi:PEBP family protease inhibitor [Candidatus Mancarchaeum acidiphilum]|uniref:PEBP family protease inhibitor n=1 Tax=Candidatus Mancarchaeum acidiphilum TaxID=1920749 RepID=A0A218NM88_9ARCH|nr:YbhB/YbcL family Raf kinase inhibitor-like protein [Candidatus Mancarchaeum acidiphilum]ASI13578.1 PEBP family protease inhibitor [Candidatus Mancarchaeum acidiphilum]